VVHLETEAVVALLGAPNEQLRFVRSAAHALENAFNSVESRREAVSHWLDLAPLDLVPINELRLRVDTLTSKGFSKFDSLHLGSAELLRADVFVTVDYPLLSRANRHSSSLSVRVTDPIRLAEEVFGGTADRNS
jgi:hypothetical protein